MKKIIAPVLGLLLFGAAAASADDAAVLPARVFRVTFAPTYAFAPGAFDEDGAYEAYDDGEGKANMLNLGFAIEYGVIGWITAAAQWAPGVNAWSDVDLKLEGKDADANIQGVADMFAGAKFQIVGKNAPVASETFRVAISPGVKIPLPCPDYKKEAENLGKDKAGTVSNLDNHVLGVGGRAHFDYVINENFFINVFSEFIAYPVKGRLKDSGLEGYIAADGIDQIKEGLAATPLADQIKYKDEVDYGYDLTFEIEPVFETAIAEGVQLTAGLPVRYKFTPGKKYDVTIPDSVLATLDGYASAGSSDAAKAAAGLREIKKQLNEDPTHSVSITPSVAVFFTGWAVPTQFKLQYGIPVAGANKIAQHSVTLQAKVFLKFF